MERPKIHGSWQDQCLYGVNTPDKIIVAAQVLGRRASGRATRDQMNPENAPKVVAAMATGSSVVVGVLWLPGI